jgi:hypothetical protein
VGDAVDDEKRVGGGFVSNCAGVNDFGGARTGFAPDGFGLRGIVAAGEEEAEK